MNSYQGRKAHLDAKVMQKLYGRTTDLPQAITLETSKQALERNRNNPEVNVVLYDDSDFTNERNDFFFEDMESAMQFCEADYGVELHSWFDLENWVEI